MARTTLLCLALAARALNAQQAPMPEPEVPLKGADRGMPVVAAPTATVQVEADQNLAGAIKRKDVNSIAALIDSIAAMGGNAVDLHGADGYTPLQMSVKAGHLEAVELLLDTYGADIDKQYTADLAGSGGTALHVAAHYNQSHLIGPLCARGADVEAMTKTQISPLYEAAQNGNLDSVKAFVACGAVIDDSYATAAGFTPLHAAAWMGKTETCEYLLARGARVNAKHRNHHGTALHMAAYYNHTETCITLLRWGAQVNDRMSGGASPLFLAVEKTAPDVAKVLLQWGADTSIPRHDGMTVFTVLFDKMVDIKSLTKSDYYVDPARDFRREDVERFTGGHDFGWLWRLGRVLLAAACSYGLHAYLKRPPPMNQREVQARLRHVRKQLRKKRG